MTADTVQREQRWSRERPCPICDGWASQPRGTGRRCHGFLSADSQYAHCSREEFAGNLSITTTSTTYAHRLTGDCRCGQRHDPTPPTPSGTTGREQQQIVATYPYHDETGTLLFETVRYRPKDFKQCRPDGRGGSIWDLQGVRRVLYRLPELRAAPDAWVFIVEGEKDVDNLRALGLVATTNPLGARTWRAEFTQDLAERKVAILPDNDGDGQAHAELVARSLAGVAAEVRIIALPNVPLKGGDVSDWLGTGGDAAQLLALVDAAPAWTLAAPATAAPAPAATADDAYTAADLLAMELSEPRFAVSTLIPEGLTILAGAPKIGKSWFILQLLLAIIAGGVALSHFAVEQGEALYLALEDNKRRLRDRIEQLLATDPHLRPHLHRLYLKNEWPRLDGGGLEALGEWLTTHPATRAVVIDTLARLRPQRQRNGDRYAEDYGALGDLQRLAADHRVAIVVIHHTTKVKHDDPLDAISGTLGLVGAADAALVLKRERGLAEARLFASGRDIDEQEFVLTFDQHTATWAIAAEGSDHAPTEERQAIQRVLAQAGKPLGPAEIARHVGKSSNAVRYLLNQMVAAGQVERPTYGQYTMPASMSGHAKVLAGSPNTAAAQQPAPALIKPESARGVSGVRETGAALAMPATQNGSFHTPHTPNTPNTAAKSAPDLEESPSVVLGVGPNTRPPSQTLPAGDPLLDYVNHRRVQRGVPALPRILPAHSANNAACLACGTKAYYRLEEPLVCAACQQAAASRTTPLASKEGAAALPF